MIRQTEDTMRKKLFPPFLNPGSYGGAVDFLHMLLDGLDLGKDVVPDLEYGPTTTQRVRDLQVSLGFTGDDVDGKFGPGTRTAFKEKHGIDVNLIEWAPQNGVTMWVDPEGRLSCWPPAPSPT